MLVWRWNQAYFKSLTGKIYPASKYSLFFCDSQLEAEYVVYIANRHYETFKLTTLCALFWAVLFGCLYIILGDWLNGMAVAIGIACFAGSLSLWIGQKMIQSPKYR